MTKDSRMKEVPDHIYSHPDIRKQTLEQVEERINEKRVNRMIMAAKHSETVLARSKKLQSKKAKQFERQNELFKNAMAATIEKIEKLETYLHKMNEINSEMINIEGIISEQEK